MKEKWMPENREQFQNQFRILFDLDETDTSVSFQQLRDAEFLSTYLPNLEGTVSNKSAIGTGLSIY